MIPQQATPFNVAAHIFAPGYRSMVGSLYFEQNSTKRNAAMELAYSDVRSAFQHFLRAAGSRPIFIAGHSQGTEHALMLLRDFFDGDDAAASALRARLVAAYLVGMPVYPHILSRVATCHSKEQIGCVVSWQTFSTAATPSNMRIEPAFSKLRAHSSTSVQLCTNPLSWTTTLEHVHSSQNVGANYIMQWSANLRYLLGVTPGIERLRRAQLALQPGVADAQCHADGSLRVTDPPLGWDSWYGPFPVWRAFVFPGGNYHPSDFNLYWGNIRQNAADRMAAFDRHQTTLL
jgi:hypothetical protein